MMILPGTEHLLPTFLKNLPETPEPARWTCAVCGVIEPHPVTFRGFTRYAKQKCACQIAERERQEREEQQRAMMAHIAQRTYNWLGARWSDNDLMEKTFDNFDASRQPVAYNAARIWVEEPTGTFVLHGTYGTGKTHLLASICHAGLRQKKLVKSLFTTSPNLFAAIQAKIAAKEDRTGILTAAIEIPLLVLDDVDKAKWSEFREEVYFEIVDRRVKAGRPMAISTNKLEALADYVGGAVCSRLKVGQIAIEMTGDDYRMEM